MKRYTLTEARERKGWSQSTLARQTKGAVSQQTISALESGAIRNPVILKVEALERALGVPRGVLKFAAHLDLAAGK